MAEGTLENVAGGKPLGQKRKRKKTKIIIGEAAKHPVSQIAPQEQIIPLKNIGKRGGSSDRGKTITGVVKPKTSSGSGIGKVDSKHRSGGRR